MADQRSIDDQSQLPPFTVEFFEDLPELSQRILMVIGLASERGFMSMEALLNHLRTRYDTKDLSAKDLRETLDQLVASQLLFFERDLYYISDQRGNINYILETYNRREDHYDW